MFKSIIAENAPFLKDVRILDTCADYVQNVIEKAKPANTKEMLNTMLGMADVLCFSFKMSHTTFKSVTRAFVSIMDEPKAN